jgi:hypothetical protein
MRVVDGAAADRAGIANIDKGTELAGVSRDWRSDRKVAGLVTQMVSTFRMLVVAAVVVCLGSPGQAQESWTCSFHGYLTQPVIVRFRVEADKLIEQTLNLEYKILQNSSSYILAVHLIDDARTPEAFVVIIDKRSGNFRRSNAILGDADDAARHGQCIKD